jgi:DNA-binding NtrC family response regulator
MKGRILVADDERRQRDILQMILEAEGYETTTAGNGRQALLAARAQPFDVVLTDLKMPDLNGIELLSELQQAEPGQCVILMTAHGTIDSAVDAMRKGAFDYLTKPVEKDELLLVLRRAMERSQLVHENKRLKEELRTRFGLESIVGAHGSMQDVFRIVHKVAASSSTVLIYGESGTGKELIARALHLESDRRAKPFYAVNVAALPESILEAELFGHEKGAFTGAESRKIGLFEQASGSTLFLDEVGDLKRDLQVKLLRTLQEREIMRGGRHRAHQGRRAHRGRHQPGPGARRARGPLPRGPLLPAERHPHRTPLAARAADGHPAAGRALPREVRRAGRRSVSQEALAMLVAYDWPGNVRELESVIERALLLGESDTIVPADLPASVRARRERAGAMPGIDIPDEGIDLDALEESLLLKALEKAGGNVSRAARLLGLSRRTMQYRMGKLQGTPAGTAAASGPDDD